MGLPWPAKSASIPAPLPWGVVDQPADHVHCEVYRIGEAEYALIAAADGDALRGAWTCGACGQQGICSGRSINLEAVIWAAKTSLEAHHMESHRDSELPAVLRPS